MAQLQIDHGLPIVITEKDSAGNLTQEQGPWEYTSSDETIVKVEQRSYQGVVGPYAIPQGPLGKATITARDTNNPVSLSVDIETVAGDPSQENSTASLGVGIPLSDLLPVEQPGPEPTE